LNLIQKSLQDEGWCLFMYYILITYRILTHSATSFSR